MLFESVDPPAPLGERQGEGADAAVGIDELPGPLIASFSEGLNQRGHHGFGLAGVHLKEGVGADAVAQTGEALLQPWTAREGEGVLSQQAVGGLILKVEAHSHHLGPAGHPGGCHRLQARQVTVGGDQGEQHLAGGLPDPQRQMAESAAPVAIDGPAAGFEILLEGLDQLVDPAIEDGAAVEIDDPVGAPPVIARSKDSISAAFQGDDRPVPVAQGRGRRKDGPHGGFEACDALEGLEHLLGFPAGLGSIIQGLEAAASAVVGQDAGGAAPVGGGADDSGDLSRPMALMTAHQADAQPIARQPARHEHHLGA